MASKEGWPDAVALGHPVHRQHHDKLLDSGTDQEFVAVGSRDGARAEAYARENGIARAHGSYEALLADPDVDAIYNPLPNSLHVRGRSGRSRPASTCCARSR